MSNKSGLSVFFVFVIVLAFVSMAMAEEVIITYVDNSSSEYGVSSAVDLEENLNVIRKFEILDGFVADVSDGEKKLLEENDEIVVSKIRQYSAILDTAVDNINATVVRRVQLNGTNITGAKHSVCVLDTGVDYTHSAFGNCWGNNNASSSCIVIGGYDFANDDSDPMDDHDYGGSTGHGTHVAGIIASGDSTYKGVAPGSKIIAMKILDNEGNGNGADILSAMEWCINNASRFNITAISMSLGDGSYETATCTDVDFDPVVQSAIANNISIVAAAGNCEGKTATTCDGSLGVAHPACLADVISVGTVSDSDTQYYQRWANFQVLAPGISITAPKYPSGGFQTIGGTSMSTPFVSSVIALIQQYSKLKNDRHLNATEIIYALNATEIRINDTATGVLYPRLDAYAALQTLPFLNFTSFNYTNLSTVNTATLTLPVELTFSEAVDFTYSINGSESKVGCVSCSVFNQTIALMGFGNLSFDLQIRDDLGNVLSLNAILYINKTSSSINNSYIGESEITFLTEDATGQEVAITGLGVYINGSSNLSITYPDGNYTVGLIDTANQTIIEFNHTLNNTNTTLDLSEAVIMQGNGTVDNSSYLIVRGINLTENIGTKTLYLKKNIASNNTCIKDAEIFGVGEISEYCNSTNEYLITCPGATGGYACEFVENDTYYKFSGLTHSAVREANDFCGDGKVDEGENCSNCEADVGSCPSPSPSSNNNNGGGGGGGGGGGAPASQEVEIVTPTAYEMKKGYNGVLEEEGAIVFKTSNGEDHNVTINKITALFVDLTVNSEPIELIMNEGDEIKLNLSSPDFYNLYIRVDALSGERVNVFIQNIFEEMRAEEEPEEEEVVADSIYKNFKAYLYFVTAIVVLIIIFIINRKINKLEKETINNKEVTINELKSKPAVKKKTKKIKRAKAKNKNEKKTKPKTKRKR